MTRSRPLGVTVLAALCALAALIALYAMLQYIHIMTLSLGRFQFFGQDVLGAVLWGVTVLCYLWAMRALWALEPQGWMFVVLISGFNLILAVVSILGASTVEALIPSIVVNGAILIYCLVPSTKTAFGQS